MRLRPAALLLALSLAVSAAAPSHAALKKYRIRTVDIVEHPLLSPRADKVGADRPQAGHSDVAFLDDSVPGAPVLRKFRFKTRSSTTHTLPCAPSPQCGFIFIRVDTLEGPGPVRKSSAFAGTGSATAGSSIRWGTVTGWTITGSLFCRGNPPSFCDFARLRDETTLDPFFHSEFYDLGTWRFHATGFTAVPFVHEYFSDEDRAFGNNQRWIRGVRIFDATVPALPLVGVALLCAALGVSGWARVARRRTRSR